MNEVIGKIIAILSIFVLTITTNNTGDFPVLARPAEEIILRMKNKNATDYTDITDYFDLFESVQSAQSVAFLFGNASCSAVSWQSRINSGV